MKLGDVKMGPKLITLFLAVGLIPLGISGVLNILRTSEALDKETENKLSAIRQIKKGQIEGWFAERYGDVEVLSSLYEVADAIARFDKGFAAEGGTESERYAAVHDHYHPLFKNYKEHYGYYDLFLIDEDGNVVYTVAKEADYASNLVNGPYRTSGLAEVFEGAMGGATTLSDFESYAPSNGDAASFIAAPVVSDGETVGVVALQMPLDAINGIMQERTGLGESGETYLVGPDYLMRSDSRFEKESTVLKKEVKTGASEAALAGESACEIVDDYRGIPVWSCYDKLDVEGVEWVILSEIDEEEASRAVSSVRSSVLLMAGLFALLVVVIAVFTARSLSKPVKRMADVAAALAEGNVEQEIELDQKDEIGDLAKAFRAMIDAQREKVRVADSIAKGDLSIDVNLASDRDALGRAMSTMKESVQALAEDAVNLGRAAVEGRLDTRVDVDRHEGEFERVVRGVNGAVEALVKHLDSMPSPLMIIDREMNIQYLNKKGCDLLDIPLEQVRGSKCFQHFKTSDCNTANCAVARALESGSSVTSETDAHPNGHDLDISYTGVPIKGVDGAVVGAFEVITDLTAEKGAMRLAEKQAAYQSTEVDKLVVNLGKVANGQLEFDTAIAEADQDTAEIHRNFQRINEALDQTVAAIRSLAEDGQLLASSAVNGDLDTRADLSRHEGEYRKVVEGINQTLDAVVDPIKEAASVLDRLLQYDLCARMEGSYAGDHAAIKEALNGTAKALHDALAQVADASEQVAGAAEQIASSSQSVAQGASEQASSLEETSSSLEEMSGQTKQNADNTQQARVLAQGMQEAAEGGSATMNKMVDAMGKIRKSSEDTSAIIKDINEIAFQTNLLALNAAVEAARAGDAGRGFAVVAEEVRNLALRAKDAAQKTEGLIAQSARLADEGETVSGEVQENLGGIMESVGRVTGLIGEIAAASQEQAQGIDQVNNAVAEMDKVVQQSAANSEESSSAAQELSSQAQELAAMVGRFQLSRSGVGTRAVVQAAPPPAQTATPVEPKGGNGHDLTAAQQLIPLDDEEVLSEF